MRGRPRFCPSYAEAAQDTDNMRFILVGAKHGLGIYSYTTGKHFTRSESHLGVRAGGDIIIAAGVTDADQEAVGKDLDLSAIGDIRLWAGGKVRNCSPHPCDRLGG